MVKCLTVQAISAANFLFIECNCWQFIQVLHQITGGVPIGYALCWRGEEAHEVVLHHSLWWGENNTLLFLKQLQRWWWGHETSASQREINFVFVRLRDLHQCYVLKLLSDHPSFQTQWNTARTVSSSGVSVSTWRICWTWGLLQRVEGAFLVW